MGATASPVDAWNGIRGVRTLPARVRQQSESAMQLATFLEAHPAIESVSYAHLPSHPQHDLAKRQISRGGAMLAFEVRGGPPAVPAFVERCRVARTALSMCGPGTLITHPPIRHCSRWEKDVKSV